MVQTQVQLTEEQTRVLDELARARKSSVAALIRQGVDQLIRQSGRADEAERRQHAMAAAGRFHSGLSNGSVEHDQYLAEAYRA